MKSALKLSAIYASIMSALGMRVVTVEPKSLSVIASSRHGGSNAKVKRAAKKRRNVLRNRRNHRG